MPVGAGPGGHTQRLLTVVKSGSIQEVKASPVDKVHTWPHLLAAEFVASLACLAFTFVFSIFVNAPLLQLANTNQTPNPSKAPWYFLGLQELLTMFHPMIAGVTIPGVGLIVLIFAPYIDKNPSNKPEDRKFATSLMTIHIMFWAVLVHHRLVLPRARASTSRCRGRTACSSSCERGVVGEFAMSSAAIIAIAIAVVVVLGAIVFVTLARRCDVRGAGALSSETRRRDEAARRARVEAEGAATAAAAGEPSRPGTAVAGSRPRRPSEPASRLVARCPSSPRLQRRCRGCRPTPRRSASAAGSSSTGPPSR